MYLMAVDLIRLNPFPFISSLFTTIEDLCATTHIPDEHDLGKKPNLKKRLQRFLFRILHLHYERVRSY